MNSYKIKYLYNWTTVNWKLNFKNIGNFAILFKSFINVNSSDVIIKTCKEFPILIRQKCPLSYKTIFSSV